MRRWSRPIVRAPFGPREGWCFGLRGRCAMHDSWGRCTGARHRLFDAVDDALADLASRAPLLLVIDDFHWADRGTVATLARSALESDDIAPRVHARTEGNAFFVEEVLRGLAEPRTRCRRASGTRSGSAYRAWATRQTS